MTTTPAPVSAPIQFLIDEIDAQLSDHRLVLAGPPDPVKKGASRVKIDELLDRRLGLMKLRDTQEAKTREADLKARDAEEGGA